MDDAMYVEEENRGNLSSSTATGSSATTSMPLTTPTSEITFAWVDYIRGYNKPRNECMKLLFRIGYQFNEPNVLYEAMSLPIAIEDYVEHMQSMAGDLTGNSAEAIQLNERSQERLSLLGESLIKLFFFNKLHRERDEDQNLVRDDVDIALLSRRLMSTKAFLAIAEKLKLNECIFYPKGKAVTARAVRENAVSTLKSLVAAVYVDGGFERMLEIAHFIFEDHYNNAIASCKVDYTENILQYARDMNERMVTFKLSGAGRSAPKKISCEVVIDDHVLGKGLGDDPSSAKMDASRAALECLSNKYKGVPKIGSPPNFQSDFDSKYLRSPTSSLFDENGENSAAGDEIVDVSQIGKVRMVAALGNDDADLKIVLLPDFALLFPPKVRAETKAEARVETRVEERMEEIGDDSLEIPPPSAINSRMAAMEATRVEEAAGDGLHVFPINAVETRMETTREEAANDLQGFQAGMGAAEETAEEDI